MKTQRQGKAAEKNPQPPAGPGAKGKPPAPAVGAEDTEGLGDTKERPDAGGQADGFTAAGGSGGVIARLRRLATKATEQSPTAPSGSSFKDDPPTPSDGGADTRNVSKVDERKDQGGKGTGFASQDGGGGKGGEAREGGGVIKCLRRAANR